MQVPRVELGQGVNLPDPKSGASANSAIPASTMLTHFIQGVPAVGSSRPVLMKAAGTDLHASYNATDRSRACWHGTSLSEIK